MVWYWALTVSPLGADNVTGSDIVTVPPVPSLVTTEPGTIDGRSASRAASTSIRGLVSPLRGSRIGTPVDWSAVRILETLAPGADWRRIAKAPVTCGAAIEVPLNTAVPPPGTEDVIDDPGASSERKGAEFEKLDTVSALVVEPTLTAPGVHAGLPIDVLEPSLPAEITVAVPADRRLATAVWNAPDGHGALNRNAPRLMFAAAMEKVLRSS